MNKVILLVLITTVISANTIFEKNNQIIKKNLYEAEQKKIFQEQKNQIDLPNETYKMDEIIVDEDRDEENCFLIEKINLENMTIFGESEFKDLIDPYLNNCNGLNKLKNLTNKISNVYINRGYVTSRAYLKPQDLTDGVVDITILEGRIEKIENNRNDSNAILEEYVDKILNLKDLEADIHQMERLRSQTAEIELYPGTKSGYSIVKIIRKKENKPCYGGIDTNNFGSKETGDIQINGNFTYENLLDIDDILTLNLYLTDNVFNQNSNLAGNLKYSFPIGRVLYELGYFHSFYQQVNLDEFGEPFLSDGNSENFSFGAKYNFMKTKRSMIELLGGLEYKRSKNYLNGMKLYLQSYDVGIANLGIKYSYGGYEENGYITFLVHKGLKGLGEETENSKIKSDFVRFILESNYTKRLLFTQEMRFNSLMRAQFSHDDLYGTEEISIGGIYTVRGFEEGGISGSSGVYVRNEFVSSFNLDDWRLSPYCGLDGGYVPKKSDNVYGSIAGTAIGIRHTYKMIEADVFYTYPLKKSEMTADGNKGFFGFSIAYEF